MSTLRLLLINFLVLAVAWLGAHIGNRFVEEPPAADIVRALVFAVAIFVALRFHARIAALLLGSVLAVTLAEVAVREAWGGNLVLQSATHFAVFGASLLGSLFAVLILRYGRASTALK